MPVRKYLHLIARSCDIVSLAWRTVLSHWKFANHFANEAIKRNKGREKERERISQYEECACHDYVLFM